MVLANPIYTCRAIWRFAGAEHTPSAPIFFPGRGTAVRLLTNSSL